MVKHGVKSNLVECIATNDIFPWISEARILFHNCCTSSIEAGFIGTPVVTYTPSNISLLQNSEVNNLFPVAKSYEDALAFLANSKNNVSSDFKDQVVGWKNLSLKNSGKIASFIADKILQRNKFETFQNVSNCFMVSNRYHSEQLR